MTTLLFEAFKAGAVDRREENVAKNWATRYVGRNFTHGYIVKDEYTNTSAQNTQWLAFNIQRPGIFRSPGARSHHPRL
ncbi:ABC transporter [Klebsiella grimontii]|uniref:ABC transporter n=1 Tax=Klebsiella grimontii TaxID=2058152 RepID=A0A7H4NZW4_9ENTR|nr:ABC transporter [Klebsiella grimontii]